MDDRDFRKHLRDLAHGHHHPDEHDWGADPSAAGGTARAPAHSRAKTTVKARKKTAQKKTARKK